MRGLVGMQVQFSLASFVSCDTDAATKSRTAHSRDRLGASEESKLTTG